MLTSCKKVSLWTETRMIRSWNLYNPPTSVSIVHTRRLLACDPLSIAVVTSEVVAESWVDGAVVVQSTTQSVRIITALRWNGCGVVTLMTNYRKVQQSYSEKNICFINAKQTTWHAVVRGAFKKFCNSIWCRNDTSKIFMLLFNIITLNTNAYVTFVKQLFDASQIE